MVMFVSAIQVLSMALIATVVLWFTMQWIGENVLKRNVETFFFFILPIAIPVFMLVEVIDAIK